MLVEYDDGSQMFLDFIVADRENVLAAIENGAMRIDDEPAAELLARLEATPRVEIRDEHGTLIGVVALDENGHAKPLEGAGLGCRDVLLADVKLYFPASEGVEVLPSDGVDYLRALARSTQTGYLNASFFDG